MIMLKIHAIVSLGCALLSLVLPVATKPISPNTPHIIYPTSQNASLGAIIPADFQVDIVHRTSPIRRDAAFMNAVGLLAKQAQLDFNGRLSRAQIIYRDPGFSPHLSILVSAPDPNQRVLRCHIFWGIARILDDMVQGNAFTGSIWRLGLGGREVGTIFFIAGTPNQLGSGSEVLDSVPSLPQSLGPIAHPTPLSAGTPIYLEFLFGGKLLTMESIFMSAVGALILLAEQRDDITCDIFRANYPGYPAYQVWYSKQAQMHEPSLMTKAVLILSVTSAVRKALEQNDFRLLRVDVKAYGPTGLLIAWGGYADTWGPTAIPELSSS
ncbi:MAG: hypothetical protein L6R36_004982 [Xanthoria steineri]|nr:MAG: hypothetical protein L6R36_004982 [Xanthoria steineri]